MDWIWQYISIQVKPPGWIHLSIQELGVAKWLQLLIEQPLVLKSNPESNVNVQDSEYLRNSTNIIKVLYTYARCHSILQLGVRENRIQLNEETAKFATSARIINPLPIPWIKGDRLRGEHPAERRLIAQLITTLDTIAQWTADSAPDWLDPAIDRSQQPSLQPASAPISSSISSQHILRLTQDLSQAFQAFDAACPIHGDSSRMDPALAPVRLGLVLLTLRSLHLLIREGLGLVAPTTL